VADLDVFNTIAFSGDFATLFFTAADTNPMEHPEQPPASPFFFTPISGGLGEKFLPK